MLFELVSKTRLVLLKFGELVQSEEETLSQEGKQSQTEVRMTLAKK